MPTSSTTPPTAAPTTRPPARRSGTRRTAASTASSAPPARAAPSPASAFLRRTNPDIRIALADPPGAALFTWFTEGELKAEGSSITEGIGVNRITGNLEGVTVDHAFRIEDAEALAIIFDLAKDEGLTLGPVQRRQRRPARSVWPAHSAPATPSSTILCDPGQRYAGKIYNPAFLRSKGFDVPAWLEDA